MPIILANSLLLISFIFIPFIKTSPSSGERVLLRLFSKVVLPEPFGPITPKNSPFFTVNEMSLNTHSSTYLKLRLETLIIWPLFFAADR
ncbi:MAG: hypothetical protein AUK23_00830 [Deltaproteobacteria bacterium CG2_30_43_15]|nr:MAG: hypothetical protein AUK23_00830 [Deltaproteobacteria bacterium CG2_30_43_15]